jgi:hypothetical protein
MSLFSWFSKKHDAPISVLPSSGLSRLESTKPANGQHVRAATHGGQPANRKQERMERRELLYLVVREAMVRAGVLSSSYKFKVLSLDTRGRQFLVMVDLAYGGGADTNRLAEIEAMIAQAAKARYDILVSAVYWRANEHVAVGDPAHHAQRPPISRPAPLQAEHRHSGPAPLSPSIPRPAELRAAQVVSGNGRIDPLQEDEVTAFKKALDAGVRGEQALASVGKGHAAASYTLLTGFEDTEMADGGADLSKTQYGALR